MARSWKYVRIDLASCRQSFVALIAFLLLSGGVAAQNQSPASPSTDLSLFTASGTRLRDIFPSLPGVKADKPVPLASSVGVKDFKGAPSSTPNPGDAPAGVRRITLVEAQQVAAQASNPLVRLGQMSVEAAKQHRLGVEGLY
jgi:hypothetical protein